MLRHIKSYFVHHRVERNGSIAILIMIGLVWSISELAFYFYTPPELEGESLAIYFAKNDTSASKYSTEVVNLSDSLFQFDPNTLSDSGFLSLGFSEKDITMLRKYQNAGGKFKSKSDFSRMYFLSDVEYDSLKPFIALPDKEAAYQDTGKYKSYKSNSIKWSDTANTSLYKYNEIICDLNRADTNELKKLPYIKSFYSRKIVEYREELGGYHTIAQLLELWKMTPETIDKFAHKVTIDQSAIRRLNVNNTTAQELAAHPYISFHLASQIVLWREEKGPFNSNDNNCLNGLLNAELCVKLAPYLAFE